MDNNDNLAKKVAQLEELLASIKQDLAKQSQTQGSGTVSSGGAMQNNTKPTPPKRVAAVQSQKQQKQPQQTSHEVDLSEKSRGEIVLNEPSVSTRHKSPDASANQKTVSQTPLKGEIVLDKSPASQKGEAKTVVVNTQDTVQSKQQPQARTETDKNAETARDKEETPDVESTIPIGEVGTFDGEFVFMPNGKKYQVPPNYASKSKLVSGDQLKLLAVGDRNDFKLVKQVERQELTGILTKKDFIWTVAANGMDFKVISASVRYYGGDIGDKATILVPKDYQQTKPEWAALVRIEKTDVNKGGFAGSESASDIELRKKMKYVPKKDGDANQSRIAPVSNKAQSTSKPQSAPKVSAISPPTNNEATQATSGEVKIESNPTSSSSEIDDMLDGVPRLR